jgi:hypothetical protein
MLFVTIFGAKIRAKKVWHFNFNHGLKSVAKGILSLQDSFRAILYRFLLVIAFAVTPQ